MTAKPDISDKSMLEEVVGRALIGTQYSVLLGRIADSSNGVLKQVINTLDKNYRFTQIVLPSGERVAAMEVSSRPAQATDYVYTLDDGKLYGIRHFHGQHPPPPHQVNPEEVLKQIFKLNPAVYTCFTTGPKGDIKSSTKQLEPGLTMASLAGSYA